MAGLDHHIAGILQRLPATFGVCEDPGRHADQDCTWDLHRCCEFDIPHFVNYKKPNYSLYHTGNTNMGYQKLPTTENNLTLTSI